MSNPYGRGEEKGPTLTLAELFGVSNAPARPPCERCNNGIKTGNEMAREDWKRTGQWRREYDTCPACGRLLLCDI